MRTPTMGVIDTGRASPTSPGSPPVGQCPIDDVTPAPGMGEIRTMLAEAGRDDSRRELASVPRPRRRRRRGLFGRRGWLSVVICWGKWRDG